MVLHSSKVSDTLTRLRMVTRRGKFGHERAVFSQDKPHTSHEIQNGPKQHWFTDRLDLASFDLPKVKEHLKYHRFGGDAEVMVTSAVRTLLRRGNVVTCASFARLKEDCVEK